MFVIQKKTSNASTLLVGSKKEQYWKINRYTESTQIYY